MFDLRSDIAGIPHKADLRGMSLKQIVTGGSATTEREFIVVSDHMVQGDKVDGYKPEPEGRMLRGNQFKYWVNSEGEQRETLYDLKNDPGEMVNIACDPRYKNDLEKCREDMINWAERNRDPYIKFMVK